MDFECDFNDLNFCQYSNLGWGFQKSVIKVQPLSNLPNNLNYFPCSVSTTASEGSMLEKKVSLNMSKSLCLRFAYLLEEKGRISIINGNNKWSKNSSGSYSRWNYIHFPISVQKMDHLTDVRSDYTVLKISGKSVCVDNFTISSQACPLTPTSFDNNFSSNPTYWLTQPFSLLVGIVILVLFFILIGIIASVMFAKKSQRALSRAKQVSRRPKQTRLDRYSFSNSPENATTINSCCGIDTVESSRFFTNNHRFLPTVVHVRSNPQLVRSSRQSFAASSSVETSESTPHYRFSLALTEDAQLQLHKISPPVSGDLSIRNVSVVRQQPLNHESSATFNENGNGQRPNSIMIASSVCAPIIDQSESDLSLQSMNPVSSAVIQNAGRGDRRRPIRESMNIGYVSDGSLCDLPQYDTAVQLLAEHKLAQLSDCGDGNEGDSNNNDIIEYDEA